MYVLLKVSRRRESKEKQKLDMLRGYKWKRLIVTVNVCNRANVYFRSRFLLSGWTISTQFYLCEYWPNTILQSSISTEGSSKESHCFCWRSQFLVALNFISEVWVSYADAWEHCLSFCTFKHKISNILAWPYTKENVVLNTLTGGATRRSYNKLR